MTCRSWDVCNRFNTVLFLLRTVSFNSQDNIITVDSSLLPLSFSSL